MSTPRAALHRVSTAVSTVVRSAVRTVRIAVRRSWPGRGGRSASGTRLDAVVSPGTAVAPLIVARRSWRALHRDLAARGAQRRESGAFLLARPGSRRITRWVAFDDLDPTCLTGGISLRGSGFSRLWDLCEAHGLTVVADVHTHPGSWVDQSPTDAANPMIAQPGHIALITPDFARTAPSANQVGVHRYHGAARWTTAGVAELGPLLLIRRLARPARALPPVQPPTVNAPTVDAPSFRSGPDTESTPNRP